MKHLSKKNNLTYKIALKTTDNAIRFVKAINLLDGDFNICMGGYLFDAKSILGVLSMDPRRIMDLTVIRDDSLSNDELTNTLKPFLA